jgi:two-component system OmpR family response regulator
MHSGAKIMVVDDEPFIVELISTRLRMAGYHVYCARDGQRALEVLRETPPDAVVLDLTMPRLDGFGVLQHMRQVPRLRAIPTMVLSARNSGEDVKRALQLGARDYLMKPFDDRVLIARVGRLLRKLGSAERVQL